MTFDLTVGVPEKTVLKNEGEIALNDLNKPCHGVALWMEYRLTDAKTVSGGLLKVRERERERDVQWNFRITDTLGAGLLSFI